jgi:hypothetical protein
MRRFIHFAHTIAKAGKFHNGYLQAGEPEMLKAA